MKNADEHTSSSLTSHDVDVGAYHIGVAYAKALLGVTEKQGTTEAIMAEFGSLMTEVIDPNPKFIKLLSSEMIGADEKRAIFNRVLGKHLSPLLMHFLHVVVAHRRGQCLRAIYKAATDLVNELRGRVEVQVTSAVPLDRAVEDQLREQLRSLLGAEPLLVPHVNPAVIGGAVFRVGDTVYDGSVSTRLERMRAQMINRSVHEIQSRRDSFSTTAGN